MAKNRRRTQKKRTKKSRRMYFVARHSAMTNSLLSDVGQVKRIDVLPDDVLLEIFDFYMKMHPSYSNKGWIEVWQFLVHVCRRWRSLVLASPRRLNLQLYCSPKTPARDVLDVWPTLPLVIRGSMTLSSTKNVIAALEQSNRVCRVNLLDLADPQLEEILATMQVPFPELTDLELISGDKTLSVVPDSFLDGSAPRLRDFILDGISFPGLPKLLLSSNHLLYLSLSNIPHDSGYISPEAVVAFISVLSSLEELTLGFQSPRSRPDWETRPPPPPNRSVIPALRSLRFKGVIEYLEDLVTRIDTPQVKGMDITFFNQIDFHTPQLARFINRTPKLTKHGAHVQFNDNFARVALPPLSRTLEIATSCKEPDWQLSFIEQVCNSSLYPLSSVEDLYIVHRYRQLVWKDNATENTQWLQLLLPFAAVKNLYLSKESAPGIAAALQELVGGGITHVLPSLQNIFVKGLEPSGPFQERIGQFVAARQQSDHPISIAVWDKYL